MRVDLELSPGVVRDIPAGALKSGYRAANNIRFVMGKPQIIGGWERASFNPMEGVCRRLHTWFNSNAIRTTAAGTHSHLYVLQGSALFNITPEGLAAGRAQSVAGSGWGTGAFGLGGYGTPSTGDIFARFWSLSNFGDFLIASPSGGTVYQWTGNVGQAATALSNAPANCNAVTVTPQRQIMAYGTNEEVGGNYNPRLVRWSDIGNANDWQASATDSAGELELAGRGGALVSALEADDGAYVWTQDEILWRRYRPQGSPLYEFDGLGPMGLIGPNAKCSLAEKTFWITPDMQIGLITRGALPTTIDCPIWDELVRNLPVGKEDQITLAANPQFEEIWIFYPDQRDGNENSRYLSLHVPSLYSGRPVWSEGRIARTAWAPPGGRTPYPLAAEPGGFLYYHEKGGTADAEPLPWSFESGDFSLDAGNRAATITKYWPEIENQIGGCDVDVLVSQYPQGAERQVRRRFSAGADQVTFRGATGRFARIRFSGSSAPAGGTFGAMTFDVMPRGTR